MRPVEDLNFHIGGKRYKFAPDRVASEDLPYLLLLITALVSRAAVFDVATFVTDKNLWYCFDAAEQ